MKNKLEQLLNSLIERGWKPTNRAKRGDVYKCEVRGISGWVNVRFFIKGEEYGNYGMNLRQLVAKDTGLRQFVCENGMIKEHTSLDKEMRWRRIRPYDAERENKYMYNTYQYRLIESALKDESELESFILDNIVIKDD